MTLLANQQGTSGNVSQKVSKRIAHRFEDDDPQEVLLKTTTGTNSQFKGKSEFDFIKTSSKQPKDIALEKHVMRDYLQPGGARVKLTNKEKSKFLLKISTLSKEVIAQCLKDALSVTENSIIMV
jgi:hypothetical protein